MQLKQYSRLNNEETRSVSITNSENCRAIVRVVGEKATCPVAEFLRHAQTVQK